MIDIINEKNINIVILEKTVGIIVDTISLSSSVGN